MADSDRNVIGIAMDLDVTDLKAGLQETKREITTANKQFAAATSGMDNWTKSSAGLNEKLKQLDTVLKNQKKNVAGIQAELEKATHQYGENSEQVRELKDQLLDAQSAVGKTEKATRKYKTQLENVETAERNATDAAKELSDSLKKTKDAADKVKDGFTVFKGVLAGLVTQGITEFIGGLKNAIDESREFRRELGYLEQGAEAAGVSFDEAKKHVKDVTAITQDQSGAVEGLNNLIAAGFSGDGLDKITDQLVGASIKWKDTLRFEHLADGLQETLATGKAIEPFAELLERGGMVAEDFDAGLAEANTTAEKQQYILDTLSKLGLEEIKTGYEEANKSLIDGAKATFDYDEAMAKVGERAEPILTTIKLGCADVLNSLLDITEGIDFAALTESISSAFKYFIDEVVPKIKELIEFVINNKDTILGAVVALGAAFAAWKIASIISGIVGAFQAWRAATAGMTIAQWLLNTAMNANPIGIIITAITLLVGAFAYLWTTSEEFRNFWLGLWDAIMQAVQPVVDGIKILFAAAWEGVKIVWDVVVTYFKLIWDGISAVFSVVSSVLGGDFSGAWDKIQEVWNGVVNWFKGIWDGISKIFAPTSGAVGGPFEDAWNAIKPVWDLVVGYFQLIWDTISGIFSVVKAVLSGDFKGAWEAIKGIWNGVGAYFQTVVNTIFSNFTNLPGKMWDIGMRMMQGLINGVKSLAGQVLDAILSPISGAIEGAKNILGIASPSKVMRDEIGKMMGAGVGEGILASTNDVMQDMDKFNRALTGKIEQIRGGLTITPANTGEARSSSVVNNYTQVINAPKQPSRIELYRQTKNLLALRGANNV